MKMCVKLFIYLAVVLVIAVFNNAGITKAKHLTGPGSLRKMDGSQKDFPKLESPSFRMRREVGTRSSDGGDIPKEGPSPPASLRTRRQAPPGESDIPKSLQEDVPNPRAKRQIPSPPDMPMPPM